ncbi:MAG: erythromycin esterase family protein [Janthinobacterium lividum]
MLACLRCLLALGGWLLPAAAQAQAVLNLALEPEANQHRPLLLWSSYLPAGGRYGLDSTVARQGRGSLHLELPTRGDAARYTTVGTGLVPLDSVRGQLVTVSAWVRTRNWRGRAGLTASATSFTRAGLSPESVSVLDSLPANQDWCRLELRLPVKATAFSFYLGLQTKGSGQVWFDDVELRVRGRRLPEWPVPATEALLLPPAQVLAPNWDFERPLPALGQPDPAAATATPDSAGPQHGRRYLHAARASGAAALPASAYLGSVPVSPREGGKTLRVLGYWRWLGGSSSGSGPAPALAARLLRTGRRTGSRWRPDTLTRRTPPPPGPAWTRFAFELPIQLTLPGTDAEADTASLGAFSLSVLLPGTGALDVDNLSFTIDGKPYAPTGALAVPPPTAAEIAWLRAAARPLQLAAPATNYQDLAALASLAGSARVLGLGEVTHGSHEGFVLNARLARYLLTQKSFECLALEAGPAACAALNNYLSTGTGSASQLLAALGEGWATTEVLALLRALRTHNQAHPSAPVQLAGFDMRQPTQALAYLREQLVDADDEFAQSRLRQLGTLLATYAHPAPDDPDLRGRPDQPQDSLLGPAQRLLAELRAGLATRAALGSPLGLQRLETLRYYLRLVEQGATWQRLSFGAAFNYRQACLAENVRYLSQTGGASGGPARVLVWASNSAVAKVLSKEERPMGQWLAATLGAGYVALGVALGQGRFTAGGPGGPTLAPLASAAPGAYEAWLRTGPAAFWLPLGPLELTEANAWLGQAQLLRDIGYPTTRNQFMLHSLRREFDAVLFVRESSATQPLP